MAPSMSQTRAILLLQKSENSAIRTEPRVVVRVRVPFAFSPDTQLLPTTINDDRTMGQSAARNSQNPDTPIPESCIRHGYPSIFPVLPNNAGHASHGTPHLQAFPDRKSTRLNSSHLVISYAVFCLKKKHTS